MESSPTCKEEDQTFDDEDAFIGISRSFSYGDHGSNEFLEMLVQKERSIFGLNQLVLDDWIKVVRSEAVEWILKAREIFRFRFETAYLSMTYFDRFLSTRSIDSNKSWAVRLLSVACLSLAAKMEEIEVPSLTEFRITQDFSFQSRAIQRMELLVLSTLEWKMMSITPFDFLPHVIMKFFSESPPKSVINSIAGITLSLTKEVKLIDYRPSVVALAATLVALDQRLTREALECKVNSILLFGHVEVENVFQCYVLMQKLGSETQTWQNLQELSPTQTRPTDVLEDRSVGSGIGAKRKRLNFDDCDKDSGSSDTK